MIQLSRYVLIVMCCLALGCQATNKESAQIQVQAAAIVIPASSSYESAVENTVSPNALNREKLMQFIRSESIGYCPVGEDGSAIQRYMLEKEKRTQTHIDELRSDNELQSNLAYLIYHKEEKSLSELEAAIKLMVMVNTEFSNGVARDVYVYSEDVGFRYASSWGSMEDVNRSIRSVGAGIKRTISEAVWASDNSVLRSEIPTVK